MIWQCLRCSDCCKEPYFGMIITKQELNILQKTTKKHIGTKKISENKYKLNGEICPFLQNNICIVYNIRPCQCRLYHCGRKNLQDKKCETIQELKQLMQTDINYKLFKEEMDLEAITYGNKHGWNWKKYIDIDSNTKTC